METETMPLVASEIKIQIAKSFKDINNEKFAELVESGFNKKLTTDYFQTTNPEYIYLAIDKENYVGAIVVESIPGLKGVSYLDKIVVALDYQGKNIGKTLWENLNGTSKKVIWRAKKGNPIRDFYDKKSDGNLDLLDIADYIFFYYGLSSQEFTKALSYAINKKPSLVEINRLNPMETKEKSENIFLDYFKFREMNRNPNYPDIYKSMKSPQVNMNKAFLDYFKFREYPGYRK